MAVRFDASGEQYTRTLSLGAQAKTSLTCWLKISNDQNEQSIAMSIGSGALSALRLETTSNGTTMMANDAFGGGSAGVGLSVGTWYFLGAAVDGVNGTFVVRALGGTSWTVQTWSDGSATRTCTTLDIGGTLGVFLDGCVSAVKLWVGATLTAEELQSEAWSVQPRRTTNLTAWYPLLITETADYSGNGYTLSGGSGTTIENGPGIGWGYRRSGLLILGPSGVTHDLASDGLASSSGDADVGGIQPLVSEGLASSSGTAVALVGAVLSSDGVATSSGAADLLAAFTLEVAGLASSTGSVDFLTAVVLASAGLATETAVGALGVSLPLAGAGAASTAGTASVGADVPLAAAGLATDAGTSALTHEGALAADGLASSAGTASLTGTHALGAAAAASSSGSAVMVVGLVFTGQASSSGSAALSLTIVVGTVVGLAATSGDSELGLEVLIGAAGVPSSTGRAVIYIALPYAPGPTDVTGRGPGGGVTGPTGITRAVGEDTGRTHG